jgi:hypothetical protein
MWGVILSYDKVSGQPNTVWNIPLAGGLPSAKADEANIIP